MLCRFNNIRVVWRAGKICVGCWDLVGHAEREQVHSIEEVMSVDNGLQGATVTAESGMGCAQVLWVRICYLVSVQCMGRVWGRSGVQGLGVEVNVIWEHFRYWSGRGGLEVYGMRLQGHG